MVLEASREREIAMNVAGKSVFLGGPVFGCRDEYEIICGLREAGALEVASASNFKAKGVDVRTLEREALRELTLLDYRSSKLGIAKKAVPHYGLLVMPPGGMVSRLGKLEWEIARFAGIEHIQWEILKPSLGERMEKEENLLI